MKTTLTVLFFACFLTACKTETQATTTPQANANTALTYKPMQLAPLTKEQLNGSKH